MTDPALLAIAFGRALIAIVLAIGGAAFVISGDDKAAEQSALFWWLSALSVLIAAVNLYNGLTMLLELP